MIRDLDVYKDAYEELTLLVQADCSLADQVEQRNMNGRNSRQDW